MAASKRDDFLRFSAYSFKELITRKLSENTKFTDQVYEGSNIAILVDLVAALFQGLTYCINSQASESMFQDTQYYSNINRLVRLIGYNPKGFIPSTCTFQWSVNEAYDDVIIPRYTAFDLNKTDKNGKKIYYSFVEDYQMTGESNEAILTNGAWKLYSTIFTSSGSQYETFTLTGLEANAEKEKYVAYKYIDVYVKRNGEFLQFKGLTDEIFANTMSKYDGGDDAIDIYKNTDDDRYFSIRLNPDKVYEIKFGNDFNGQKLQAGDQVYVFYLDTNGLDAELVTGEITKAKLVKGYEMTGLEKDMFYRDICKITSSSTQETIEEGIETINNAMNISEATTAIVEEDVEDIRENAPNYYKLGNRLITKDDYEYYVKNRFAGNIIDVKCQNNWDYISTFFGWLYKLGKSGVLLDYPEIGKRKEVDPRYYINQTKLKKYDYKFADAADSNNVYLWVKMQNDMNIWKQIDEDLISLKCLTSETVCLEPVIMNFALCAARPARVLQKYLTKEATFDILGETYIEITIDDNSLFTNSAIKSQVNEIFMEFFNENNLTLGQLMNLNDLENRIYAISGIQRIRTVFSSKYVDGAEDVFVDGLSFASWSASLIDKGDDLVVGNGNRKLEVF